VSRASDVVTLVGLAVNGAQLGGKARVQWIGQIFERAEGIEKIGHCRSAAKGKSMDKRISAAECFGTGIATKILLYPAWILSGDWGDKSGPFGDTCPDNYHTDSWIISTGSPVRWPFSNK
jgi:hypothetical protein